MATYESKKYSHTGSLITNLQSPNIADGTVSDVEFQRLDGVTSDIQTQINGRVSPAGATFTGDLDLQDNVRERFGNSQDLQIYHNGTNSIIDNGTGQLIINADVLQLKNGASNSTLANLNQAGAVNLFFNGSTKISTTNTGANINGTATATTFSGSGASLTNLDAGNLSSGTVPNTRIQGANLTGLNASALDSGTIQNARYGTPTFNGSQITNLNGSNIASGTVADARISTLTSSKLTGALPALDGSALTGIESVPSATTSIGSIMPFMLKRSGNSSQGNLTLSAGTEVTPSTYTSGIFVISDYDGSLSRVEKASPNYAMGNTKGFMGISQQTSGSSTSKTGVWRVIDPLFAGSATGGQGNGSYTYFYSIMGLMQRIS